MSADEQTPEPPSARNLAGLSLLAEELPALVPPPFVRDRLLTQLRGAERFVPHAPFVSARFGLELEDARDALRLIASKQLWRAGMWPGSQFLTTPALVERRALIAELPAGACIASHRHEVRELTYVLDGELLETRSNKLESPGKPRVHGHGALLDMEPGSRHELAVSLRGPCLVVFAITTS